MRINLIKTIALILSFIVIVGVPNALAQQFKVVGYMAYWDGNVNAIQFGKLTHVNYAFLQANPNGSLQAIPDSSLLQSLVSAGHAAGVKVLISVGGWNNGDTSEFESLAANSTYATAFVNNMVNFVNQYNLDGVDIDWEYPVAGASATHYASLMAQLSSALHGRGKLLTAAVIAWGGDSILSSVFNSADWLNLMDYDNTNGIDQSTYASVTTSLDYWVTQRGLLRSKAVMGVPFYGDPNGQYSFAQLIAMGASPNADSWNGYGYNGIPTIKQKTALCLQDKIGGMMMWELANDATGSNSLLSAMYATIQSTTGGGTVPQNGKVYHFICQKSGKALDNAGSTANGSAVTQWTDVAGNSNQAWKLVDVGSGYYNLVCQKSGKALDNGGSTSNGTTVTQWTQMSGNINQSWKFVGVGGGYYNLICQKSGKALDNAGSTTNGAKVTQWTEVSGNPNQNWKLELVP